VTGETAIEAEVVGDATLLFCIIQLTILAENGREVLLQWGQSEQQGREEGSVGGGSGGQQSRIAQRQMGVVVVRGGSGSGGLVAQ